MLKINPHSGETEQISVFDLLDGGVKELAELNLSRVLENIRDVNTDAKKSRTLTVKFTFQPNENRDSVNVDIAVSCKTVPIRAVATTLDIGEDGGQAIAVERPKYTPGQLRLEDNNSNVTNINAVKTAAQG